MANHPWILALAICGGAALITAVVLYLVYRKSLKRAATLVLTNTGNAPARYDIHGEDLLGLRYTFFSDSTPLQMIRVADARPAAQNKQRTAPGTGGIKEGREKLRSASRTARSINKLAMLLPADLRKSIMGVTGQVQQVEGKVQRAESTERRIKSAAGQASKIVPVKAASVSGTAAAEPAHTNADTAQNGEHQTAHDVARTSIVEPGNRLKLECAITSPMRVNRNQIPYRIVSQGLQQAEDVSVLEGTFDGSKANALRLWSLVLLILGLVWGSYALYWLLTYGV